MNCPSDEPATRGGFGSELEYVGAGGRGVAVVVEPVPQKLVIPGTALTRDTRYLATRDGMDSNAHPRIAGKNEAEAPLTGSGVWVDQDLAEHGLTLLGNVHP